MARRCRVTLDLHGQSRGARLDRSNEFTEPLLYHKPPRQRRFVAVWALVSARLSFLLGVDGPRHGLCPGSWHGQRDAGRESHPITLCRLAQSCTGPARSGRAVCNGIPVKAQRSCGIPRSLHTDARVQARGKCPQLHVLIPCSCTPMHTPARATHTPRSTCVQGFPCAAG